MKLRKHKDLTFAKINRNDRSMEIIPDTDRKINRRMLVIVGKFKRKYSQTFHCYVNPN